MIRRASAVTATGAAVGAVAAGVALHRLAAPWRPTSGDASSGIPTEPFPVGTRHHLVPTSDGGLIHAVERGSGPALLLVPGVTLTAEVWAGQLERLAATNRVIAVDQRGHGRSEAGSAGYRFEAMAEDLLVVLQTLGVERAVLVGHSMGGMVALRAASAEGPSDRLAGLVLLGSDAGPLLPPRLPRALGEAVGSGGRRALQRAAARGWGLFPVPDAAALGARAAFGTRPDPAEVARTARIMDAMAPAAMAGILPELMGFDVRDQLDRITLPTRVVVGSRDVLTPPRRARALAAGIAGAELVELPGAGHMVMLERADVVEELLARLSDQVTGVPRS